MKNVILTIIAVAALGTAGYLTLSNGGETRPDNERMDTEKFFVCKNPECKNEFSMTLREYAKTRGAEGNPPCPECGKHLTTLAEHCPECHRNIPLVGHASVPPECPFCGHKFGNYGEAFQREKKFHKDVSAEDGGGG